jgi:nicotinamide-nucleotide amidase
VTAEIVSVGTELLLGQITDTNATFISEKLAERGVNVYFRQTVGDNLDRLCAALRLAGSRSDVVIITGGLGPTDDDITREAIAGIVGVELEEDPQALASIEAFLKARGRSLNAAARRQARVPAGGTITPNRYGTAPGIMVEYDGGELIALPGVPSEMRAMMEDSVLPHLEVCGGGRGEIIKSRILHLAGVGESALGGLIGDVLDEQSDPTIAPYAAVGGVQLRITTKAASDEEATAKIAHVEQQLRERLGTFVFGADDATLEAAVGSILAERGLTVTTAESCTGGLIADRLTELRVLCWRRRNVQQRRENTAVGACARADRAAWQRQPSGG